MARTPQRLGRTGDQGVATFSTVTSRLAGGHTIDLDPLRCPSMERQPTWLALWQGGLSVYDDAGDLSAHQTPPGDRDGKELIRQYRAMTKHRREQVYNVPGNHDAPYYDHGPGSWFRKWG